MFFDFAHQVTFNSSSSVKIPSITQNLFVSTHSILQSSLSVFKLSTGCASQNQWTQISIDLVFLENCHFSRSNLSNLDQVTVPKVILFRQLYMWNGSSIEQSADSLKFKFWRNSYCRNSIFIHVVKTQFRNWSSNNYTIDTELNNSFD